MWAQCDNVSQVILSPNASTSSLPWRYPCFGSTYRVLPVPPPALHPLVLPPHASWLTPTTMWDPPEVAATPLLSDKQNAAVPGPSAACSLLAALPAPRAALGLVTLKQRALSSRHQPACPPACLCSLLPPPAPWAGFERVVASAALSFGASRCALLPSANCQYLSWHPISTIPANDCEGCIRFHPLKGFLWLKSSRGARVGRAAGGQALVLTEQSVLIITKCSSL